jgi:hypothetical protein
MTKKIYGIKPKPSDDGIRRVAAKITTVNTIIKDIVTKITDTPDPTTKQESLDRLTLLKSELASLLRI